MKRVIAAKVPEGIKEVLRDLLALEHPYGLPRSEERRLRRSARHRESVVKLFGGRFHICDAASFLASHDEIFRRGIYRFSTSNPQPLIIDGGANVGLATLFFKRTHKNARVVAVEADPAVAELLQENIRSYGLSDIEVLTGALWDSAEELQFNPDHADGGSVATGGGTKVQGILLSDLIDGRTVDLLKLDIEGAETRVLSEASDHLGGVDRLFVEFHGRRDEPQSLDDVLRLLKNAGFRWYLEDTCVFRRQPFEEQAQGNFDLQVNVYASRIAEE